MEKIKKYIEENKERFFEELFDFIGVAELTGEAGYTDLEKILGIKSILMGFGLDSDAIHSPNENYPVINFFRGIETIPLFFRHYNKLKNR